MMESSRRIKTERDRERQERRPRERVVRKDGKVVAIDAEHVDTLKDKKGLRPVGRNGMSAALHFGMSQAFSRYEKGPDGLTFMWDGGWVPTELFGGHKLSGYQRDPGGNLWVKVDGEWLLEDEVA